MGIFKDMKVMREQAKELRKQSGASGVGGEGISGTARLLAARDAAITVGGPTVGGLDNPVTELDLEVAVDGGEPYRITITQMVPRLQVARLAPGAELPVKVDPGDSSKVVVDWDAPPVA